MIWLFMIFVSMIVIAKACDGFEEASNYLGRNLSDGVKGATINAIGSSMPELFSASIALLIYANTTGYAFGVGTTAGSAIFNVAVIPALVILTVIFAGMTKSITISKKVALRDGLWLIAAEIIFIMVLSGGVLDWYHGLILLLTYAAYITYTLKTMGSSNEEEESGLENLDGVEEGSDEQGNKLLSWLKLDLVSCIPVKGTSSAVWLLVTSIAFIGVACWALVEACYGIGEMIGIPIYFISVILAAAATSIPDTIISIKDAKAGNYDDAVSNALGSNIFDITVCMGLPLFLYCLFYGTSIVVDTASAGSVAVLRVVLLVFTIIAFGINYFSKGMGKLQAAMLLTLYISFVGFILANASGYEPAVQISNSIVEMMK